MSSPRDPSIEHRALSHRPRFFQGNVSSWWARIIVGALLLIFIVLQKLLTRRTDAAAAD